MATSRAVLLSLISVWLAVACGGGAGGSGSGGASGSRGGATAGGDEAEKPPSQQAARGDRGGAGAGPEQLATDLAAHALCQRLDGKFLGLGSGTVEGRMWVRGCDARTTESGALHVDVDALIWSWVHRTSGSVGASFELEQYVVLDADVGMTGSVELAYDRPERLAYGFLVPGSEPEVSVRPIGNIDVDAQGAWSSIVGAVADVFGESPSQRARAQVRAQGRQRIRSQLGDGMTVAIDLCVGIPRTTLDRLEVGQMPEPPVEPPDRTWIDSQRVRVRVMGIDVSGPYALDDHPIAADVHVTEGSPVRAQLVCAADAERMVRGWLEGSYDAIPEVDALAEARVARGERTTIRASAECDVALVTLPVSDARAASVIESVVYGVRRGPRALVDGCEAGAGSGG